MSRSPRIRSVPQRDSRRPYWSSARGSRESGGFGQGECPSASATSGGYSVGTSRLPFRARRRAGAVASPDASGEYSPRQELVPGSGGLPPLRARNPAGSQPIIRRLRSSSRRTQGDRCPWQRHRWIHTATPTPGTRLRAHTLSLIASLLASFPWMLMRSLERCSWTSSFLRPCLSES